MQQLINSFDFNGHGVRVITNEKDQVFFVAKDVCDVLGYSNSRDAIAKHCKKEGVANCDIPTESGIQQMTIINEGNLYRLVLRSKKKESEVFESWVCDEVLPSIRKTGSYTVPQKELSRKEIAFNLYEAEVRNELLEIKVDNLSTALDVLVEWVSIIKVSRFNKVHESKFNWRLLKRKSEEMGFAIKKSESPRFGFQNLYNINVFRSCYPQFNYKFLNKD